ncbi:MAG: hypothetical protein JOZ27_08385, partial [Caulobacteraceae bacterium]|nr:hypothetical protein [Caulobacteraceae bacterium]
MRRRTLLGAALAAPILGVSAGPAAAAAPLALRRRVRPTDAAWPGEEAWRGLGRAVGGRLFKPEPLLAPCQPDAATAACKARFAALRNPFFIGDQASGTEVSGWLDAWTPA